MTDQDNIAGQSDSQSDAAPSAATATAGSVRLEGADGVGVVVLDVPDRKLNVLDVDLLEELVRVIANAAERPFYRALILTSAKQGGFCAGANVESIGAVRDREEGTRLAALGQDAFARIERLSLPVVAAIHGVCLGGGLELALACTGILAADDDATRLGLPEVRLGIVPGFGGTQRLPRRIGLVKSLDLILTGRTLDGRRARSCGLADDLVDPLLLLQEARRYALELADGKPPRGRKRRGGLGRRLVSLPPLRKLVLSRARKGVLAKTRGVYPAPLKAIELVELSYGSDRAKGFAAEAAAVGELLAGDVSHALIDLFQIMEALKRQGGAQQGFENGDQIGVVGAGVMGAGIARRFLQKGAAVRLMDVDADSLGRGVAGIARDFDRDVRRGRLTSHARDRTLDRLAPTVGLDGLSRVSLVVEAVVERLDVKSAVFSDLDERTPASAPLYTNTSTIPLEQIGAAVGRPTRVVGLHFFNPVDRMPLIEVVVPAQADEVEVERACAVARKLGKVPVRVKDSPGFLVNRVLAPYLSESLLLLEEGVDPDRIDRSMIRLGFAMGPLKVMDTVGLDVATAAAESLRPFLGERLGEPRIGKILAEQGHLGNKSGGGIRGPKGKPAAWLAAGLEQARRERGISTREVSDQELEERLLYRMLAEAARAYREGIVVDRGHLDAALVLGAGFPPVLGGPLKELQRRGIDPVREALARLEQSHGSRFAPGSELVSDRIDREDARPD